MKIGLVGYPGSGKTTVFNALTGLDARTGFGSADKQNLGSVRVPDPRVDQLAALYRPRKVTYAEVTFVDLGAGHGDEIDRAALNAMREVDALCQVLRGFTDASGRAPDPLGEVASLELETILADLEIVERRVARLEKDHSSPRELALSRRLAESLGREVPIRRLELDPAEEKLLSGYRFLSQKPLLLCLNLPEAQAAEAPPPELARAAEERGLGLTALSAQVDMDIAQMPAEEQGEFLAALGLERPARDRFIQAAFSLLDLVSMLTYGEDECRAWPIRRGTPAPRAAGKIHSDIERGFIRAEVIAYEDLVAFGSDARARDAGKARVEGKEYVVRDGDCIHFRFNV